MYAASDCKCNNNNVMKFYSKTSSGVTHFQYISCQQVP